MREILVCLEHLLAVERNLIYLADENYLMFALRNTIFIFRCHFVEEGTGYLLFEGDEILLSTHKFEKILDEVDKMLANKNYIILPNRGAKMIRSALELSPDTLSNLLQRKIWGKSDIPASLSWEENSASPEEKSDVGEVMKQTGCSRFVAEKCLQENHGDIVSAILAAGSF